MLISCPKCNSVYNISETRIPGGGKKFKCAECGQVWRVFPQDVQPIEPENKKNGGYGPEQNEDINIMFSRLSHNTKNLFVGESAVENMAAADKLRHFCRNFFSAYMIIAFLLVLIILLAGYLVYGKRYDIVAGVPAMEKLYSRFNVESVYNGRNLIFRSIRIREIGYGKKQAIEISGRLHNNGNITVSTMPIKVSFIGDNGEVESEIIELLPPQRIAPNSSTLFRIVADNPSDKVRKVQLNLEDITKD